MNYRFILLLVTIIFTVSVVSLGQQQVENPGFEFWEEYGYGPDTLEPVNWNSLRTSDGGDLINGVIPVTMYRSTDAHSGMYSVKLENDTILGMVAPGTMTNGRVHATLPPSDAYVYTIDSLPEFNTPFTGLPDSLKVWAKFSPQDGDIGRLIAVLHTDTAKIADSTQTNWIAIAEVAFSGEITEWTEFEVPFEYLNSETPEYILFAIYAGDAANSLLGSILYLDDLEMVYYNTGIPTFAEENIKVYFSNDQLIADLQNANIKEDCKLEIVDLSGRILISKQIKQNEINKIQINIPTGIYICNIQNKSSNYSQKIIKK